jgi:hypothetical protein
VPKVRAFTDFVVPRLKKHFALLKKSLAVVFQEVVHLV